MVAAESPPLVLALDKMTNTEMCQFVEAFFRRIYEINKNPVHLVLDEGDEFAPQRVGNKKAVFEAVDRVIRRGRNKGIGATLISQRSSVINKDDLSQCGTMIAHRSMHHLDRGAILDWIGSRYTPQQVKEVDDSLASLRNGEAWVISPEFLKVFKRVKMHDRMTWNSSATPVVGIKTIVPKRMSEVPYDLDKLARRLDVESLTEESPGYMRERIEELTTELRKAQERIEDLEASGPGQTPDERAELIRRLDIAVSELAVVKSCIAGATVETRPNRLLTAGNIEYLEPEDD